MAQLVEQLTRNWLVMSSNPVKGSRFPLEQECIPLPQSTGWFQERIRA